MNANNLLNRCAERGTPRGPANVWANAQLTHTANDSRTSHGSPWLFRMALLAWVVGLVAVGVARPGLTNQPVSESSAPADPATYTSDEPLPAPLLVEGGTLKQNRGGVRRPFDPEFDGDDIFDRILPNTRPSEVSDFSQEPPTTTVVFARPTDPFEGPIVGIELFDGGGFRPWGANLTGAELTDFTQYLERVNGDWSIADGSGLEEVARFQDDHLNMLMLGWQFDFQLPANEELTIQAETNGGDRVISEWVWIARLTDQEQTNATVKPVNVLGHDGFVIDSEGSDDRTGDDGVVWESDGFVYRMTSTLLEDNTSFGRDSTQDVERLRVADRSEWVDAISVSSKTPTGDWIVGALGLAILLAVAMSTLFFLVRRSFQAAAVGAATACSWLFFVGSPAYLGTVAMTALGLGLAWWLHKNTTRASLAQAANP